MEHKEYKRIDKNSDVAILFIHGIVGTPNHFNKFIPLVPKTVSVYNMLLDGHGKGVRDFSHTSMRKWVAQVESAVDELASTHKEVYIVAHSMGTLFAIEQAIKNKNIAALFLLAVPLKVSLKPEMFANSWKVHRNRIKPDDHVALAAKNCYGIAENSNPFHYIGWIPRFVELLSKIRYTRKNLNALETPCFVYQSQNDEMVSKRSVDFLSRNPSIIVNELKNSGHYYYEEADWNVLLSRFRRFIDEICS